MYCIYGVFDYYVLGLESIIIIMLFKTIIKNTVFLK